MNASAVIFKVILAMNMLLISLVVVEGQQRAPKSATKSPLSAREQARQMMANRSDDQLIRIAALPRKAEVTGLYRGRAIFSSTFRAQTPTSRALLPKQRSA